MTGTTKPKLPDTKPRRGEKQVVCPRCNEMGTMIVRERGRKKYIYVQHKVWDSDAKKQKTIEHYIGSASDWYLTSGIKDKELISKHTVRVEVNAVVSGDEEVIKIPDPYTCIRRNLFDDVDEKLKDIRFVRQVILDYVTFLTVIERAIDSRINAYKERYGISDEDVEKRIRDFFIPMRFYIKLSSIKLRGRKTRKS